ncbi:Protein-lysine N-methyltransferase efm4, partial [Linderina macrospora]
QLATTPTQYVPDMQQPREILRQELSAAKSHHNNGKYKNPWDSFQMPTVKMLLTHFLFGSDTKPVKQSIAEGRAPEVVPLDMQVLKNPPNGGLQFTWLGHSSLFLQADGANILLDPVLSERCSPVQWIGPKRYTKAPCTIAELPRIDAVVLSHNHYDHLDWNTLKDVVRQYPDVQVFAPLGNQPILQSIGFKHISIMDWWDEKDVTLNGSTLRLACTPAQHATNRGLFDRYTTLWASWVIMSPSGGKFFFSGDTSYSALVGNPTGANCPAFEQIGQVYGPIDLSAIAIGAYGPEKVFSGVHVSPEQAVKIHEEIGSRRSIGVHWGTFVLTDEPVDEPPQRLADEMKLRGHASDGFTVIKIGQTVVQDIQK